jgi:hypothetical protein
LSVYLPEPLGIMSRQCLIKVIPEILDIRESVPCFIHRTTPLLKDPNNPGCCIDMQIKAVHPVFRPDLPAPAGAAVSAALTGMASAAIPISTAIPG